MTTLKLFPLFAAAALTIGAAPAHADTYRSEYVRPDGSAHVCTTTFRSISSSTRCGNLTAKQRAAGQELLIEGYRLINHCAERRTAENWKALGFEERNRMWETCMGH